MEVLGGCYEQILFGFSIQPAEVSFLNKRRGGHRKSESFQSLTGLLYSPRGPHAPRATPKSRATNACARAGEARELAFALLSFLPRSLGGVARARLRLVSSGCGLAGGGGGKWDVPAQSAGHGFPSRLASPRLSFRAASVVVHVGQRRSRQFFFF